MRRFDVGDTVEIVAGQGHGERATVKYRNNLACVVTLANGEEIPKMASDLQKATGSSLNITMPVARKS